jgi:hypothetical protein
VSISNSEHKLHDVSLSAFLTCEFAFLDLSKRDCQKWGFKERRDIDHRMRNVNQPSSVGCMRVHSRAIAGTQFLSGDLAFRPSLNSTNPDPSRSSLGRVGVAVAVVVVTVEMRLELAQVA